MDLFNNNVFSTYYVPGIVAGNGLGIEQNKTKSLVGAMDQR